MKTAVSRIATRIILVLCCVSTVVVAGRKKKRDEEQPSSTSEEHHHTNNQHRPAMKVVLLGDSYSSGTGARDEDGDKNYNGPDGCMRSDTNWGKPYANHLHHMHGYDVQYVNAACAGAVIDDVMNPRFMDSSRGLCPEYNRIGIGHTAKMPDDYYIQVSNDECQRYMKPQIYAIDKTVDLVIMTLGGNDVGLSDLIVKCLVLRQARGCRDFVDDSITLLSKMTDDLADVLLEIRNRMSPSGKIVIVSYPYIVINRKFIIRDGFYDLDAAAAIRNLCYEGSKFQQDAISIANALDGTDFAIFHDTKPLFAGHEADPRPFRRNKSRWIREIESTSLVESYHFNPKGYQHLSESLVVQGAFGSLMYE